MTLTRLMLAAVCAVVLPATACNTPEPVDEAKLEDPPSAIEFTGPITTIDNGSDAVWGSSATLLEEASIGAADGDPAYLLGEPMGIAATADRIYVLDRQPPKVRTYDFRGRHIGDFGQAGQGPGEFRLPTGIAVGPKGNVYVRDGTRRVNSFTPSGEVSDAWRVELVTSVTGRPMTMTDDGVLYVADREDVPVERSQRPQVMRATGPGGRLGDFIRVPRVEFEPQVLVSGGTAVRMVLRIPFTPREVWAMAPSGAVIGGLTSEYRFEVRHPRDGQTVVQRDWEPLAVSADERRWHEERITARRRRTDPAWTWDGPPIPPTKPAYEAIFPALDGRIWVLRISGPSTRLDCAEPTLRSPDVRPDPCWQHQYSLDVFDSTGRYLGDVAVPAGMVFKPEPFIRGDTVIAAFEDEAGTIMVKRYRLLPPEKQ